MIALAEVESKQIPLIHLIHEDDKRLLECERNEWFKALHSFRWEDYREHAARYYDELYDFNIEAVQKKQDDHVGISETKEAARERLLFARATMRSDKPAIIYNGQEIGAETPRTDPQQISPGNVPERFGGRKPKCFFSLFKSFLGTVLMGFAAEPEHVYKLLESNLSFVRACGFVTRGTQEEYYYKHIPSLRKLEQFDQIMRESGLWNKIKWDEVKQNIEEQIIQIEKELVGDTTHYYAYSNFETVEYIDEKGKKRKKSQSKVTKPCRCEDWAECGHEWNLRDDGAGTVIKSNKKMYWAHKASILGFPVQGIPLDAVAISDAATHDGKTLYPHIDSNPKIWLD